MSRWCHLRTLRAVLTSMRWLLLLGVGVGTLVCVTAWRIDRAGVVDDARPADVIVVLGARVQPDGTASPTLRARVEHAVELYRRGLAAKVLFSGGVGDFGSSEAEVSRALAVSLGVPGEACLLEEQSHSTKQNAAFSGELIRARGWRSVLVVTDPYHLPRARRLFAAEGLEVSGSPVLGAPRHRSWSERVYWTLREVAAHARP
jgi:uncharacterized SAM-binding protein YcdF (DUF218 family)